MFGLKLVRHDDLQRLIETTTSYERALEDIGWINLSTDPSNSTNKLIANGFDKMLHSCKVYYYNNPLAGLAVSLTTAFVFGEGISKPKAKDEKIQSEVIDPFWDDPDNKLSISSFHAQELLSNKLQYEGNIFFLFFDDEVGNVKTRILNTDQVVDVIRSDDDSLRPLFYKVKNTKRNYNFKSDSYENIVDDFIYYADIAVTNPQSYGIPPKKLRLDARVYHVKDNCDINDKFGVPILYRAMDWMKAHKDMSGDLATLIKALSKFAWKKKVQGTAAQVNSIAGNMRTTTSLSNIRNSAGQTQVENQSVDMESMDIKTGGTDINIKGMREMKLMTCAAFGIYEHYFGDPSTGNLATAKSMELPMVKKFTNLQSRWTEIYTNIFHYIISLKIGLGVLAGEEQVDTKSERVTYKYSGDDAIDTDFPPILEADLSPLADALTKGKDGGLVTEDLAAETFMLALNVNNLDEEMEELKEEREANEAKAQEKELATIKANQGIFPGAAAPVKESGKKGCCDPLSEAISSSDKKTRFDRKGNFVTQRMNGYRKSLSSHYNDFKKKIARNVDFAEKDGRFVGTVKDLDKYLALLETGMNKAAKAYFPVAVEIGTKFVQSHIPKDKIKESLFEAGTKKGDFTKSMLAWNAGFISDSLIPDMEKRIMESVKQAYDSENALKAAVSDAVTSFESRVEQYVGAFWTVEEKAVKEAGTGQGLMVNFAGADDESSCQECADAVANSPYPLEEAPVPGELQCLGNCRHALQIIDKEG